MPVERAQMPLDALYGPALGMFAFARLPGISKGYEQWCVN